jgi:putative oxidoreductase
MEELERLRRWLDAHRELWLDLLRVYFGFALFAKGVAFALEGSTLFDTVQSANIGFGEGAIAHYVIVAHIGGGLFLGLGLLTRLMAAIQLPILAGAVFLVHRKEGLFTAQMTLEFTILVLVLLVLFTAAGAGRLSVDHWLRHRSPATASKIA